MSLDSVHRRSNYLPPPAAGAVLGNDAASGKTAKCKAVAHGKKPKGDQT